MRSFWFCASPLHLHVSRPGICILPREVIVQVNSSELLPFYIFTIHIPKYSVKNWIFGLEFTINESLQTLQGMLPCSNSIGILGRMIPAYVAFNFNFQGSTFKFPMIISRSTGYMCIVNNKMLFQYLYEYGIDNCTAYKSL